MGSDLVSGPDLGGGYLHQLSLDREDDRTTFSYHAQDGGADANGPPIGGLDGFGWVHPPNPCQFGGPRCWHRRFLLPFASVPSVRQAYNRNRFVLETMLRQRFGDRSVPWDAALGTIVSRVQEPLARDRIPWYVGGEVGARLLGAELRPSTIRLGTDRRGVDRLGDLLSEFLIEPVAPTDHPPAGIVRGGRAFVGTFVEGARVEWAVPLGADRGRAGEALGGEPSVPRLLTAHFQGHELPVARPEYALVEALAARNAPAVASLTETVRRTGSDRALLAALLRDSSIPEPDARRVQRGLES